MRGRNAAARFTGDDRRNLRERLRNGESFGSAAKAIGCSTKSVQRLLNHNGGLWDRSKPRSPLRLSEREREEISRGLLVGLSLRAIAKGLGRSASTVSRDVKLGGGRENYRAVTTDERARKRRKRPKEIKLLTNKRLREEVENRLSKRWSPEQICHSLRKDFPEDPGMQISHETIYAALFVQARGALRKELAICLRTRRTRRRAHNRSNASGRIRDMVNIRERPAEAADRAIPGHWEGDLIMGRLGQSAMATLVERKSRFVMLIRLAGDKTAPAVAAALAKKIKSLPKNLMRSITWDQGKEMAGHAKFTLTHKIPIFFCDPRSPWQRGSNENTNGLLRQYFPRSLDFSALTEKQLDVVAEELNERPRETLDWRTPAEVLDEALR